MNKTEKSDLKYGVQKTKAQMLRGLSAAEVEQSRAKHGENVLTPPRGTSLWKLYLDKYRDPIIQILIVTAIISLVLAFFNGEFIESIGIILAIFLATTVGFYFERDAAKKFSVLNALGEEQMVKVRRDGHVTQIARRDVVVGDVLILEMGDEISADGMLLDSTDLQIDESSLTGEPIVSKYADTSKSGNDDAYAVNQVLRSTMVMNGRGEAIVTAVGDETEIGKVARQATEMTSTKTPLSIQLDKLASLISKIGATVALIAFFAFLVHDLLSNNMWAGYDWIHIVEKVLAYFMMAVTLIVMAVPEGLPMAITLSLALNMRRMLKSNNLVRKLHACETIGAVTVICTDKTGTLTQNKMQVREMFIKEERGERREERDFCVKEERGFIKEERGERREERDFCVKEERGERREEREYNIENGEILEKFDSVPFETSVAINTTAELDGERGVGNPTEVALLLWLKGQGKDYIELRKSVEVERQMPFSTETKYMMTAVRLADGSRWLVAKGAPEIVLSHCRMDNEDRQYVEHLLLSYQQKAMRTLAFACKRMDNVPFPEHIPDEMSCQAVCGIADPVRDDVPSAVSDCASAGIKVKMVTGDTSATAIEIGRQIGIWSAECDADKDRFHITGADFAKLSDAEAYEKVTDLRVMSRARPTDKQRLVQLLQRHNEVVAVTGDGTNDAPALNYAHVGLSLGSGTSVAKEASDMTLIDDSFRSIVNGVMWGRSLYKNIQRFLFFQLVVNVTALLFTLGGAVIGTEMPLTVTQILWVNLIMDTFAAMALASLAPSREVMKEKPRRQSDFIITKPMFRGIIVMGVAFALLMIAMLYRAEYGADRGVQIDELTIVFTVFVMIQFWNLFNAKMLGSNHSAFRKIWRDKGFLIVLALILIGQVLIVTFGGNMFRVAPLSLENWLLIIGITSVVMIAGEVWRAAKRMTN